MITTKTTAKAELMRVLPPETSMNWTAIHELGIMGYSETALSARLREMAAVGKVVGRYRPGRGLKEWARPLNVIRGEPNRKKPGITVNISEIRKGGDGELFDRIVIDVPAGKFHTGQEVRII